MNIQENTSMGVTENIVTVTTTNVSSSFVNDKRPIPLLYMQPPLSQTGTVVCSSAELQNVSSVSLPNATNAINGVNGKVVHVQGVPNQSSTYAYIGAILKPSIVRKDPVHQKVLLDAGVPVKRLILPRSSPGVMKVVLPQSQGKSMCRNYVLQATGPNTLKSTSIIGKSPAFLEPSIGGMSKNIAPNIIRQKQVDGKLTFFPPPIVPKGSPSTNQPMSKIIIKNEADSQESILIHIPEATTTVSSITPTPNASVTFANTSVVTSSVNSEIVNTPQLPTGTTIQKAVTEKNSEKTIENTVTLTPICPEIFTIDDDGDEEVSAPKSSVVTTSSTTTAPPFAPLPPLTPFPKGDSPQQTSKIIHPEEVKKEKQEEPKIGTAPVLVERARKRKGCLMNEINKKPASFSWQMETTKLLPGADEYDPIEVIEWDSKGVGRLPGSDIKFILNEFGLLEIFEESLLKNSGKQDGLRWNQEKDSEEIFCCFTCKCYGLISEFYCETFCSKTCKESVRGKLKKRAMMQFENELEKKKKRKLIQLAMNSKPIFSELPEPINSPKLPEREEDIIKEEDLKSEIISIDDNESLSSQSIHSDGEEKISEEEPLAKTKETKKDTIKEDRSDKPYMPHRTYSKYYKRSSLNLRTREVQPCEEEELKEPEQISDSEVSKKQETKKQNSENASPKNSVVTKEKPGDFRWSTYLSQTVSKPAWFKLFINPFPTAPNPFKVGYKLEAIDSEHQSYFCAVTVVEVKGFRLKLHFDGYSKVYDFWVNSDSPNIFPCGYCSRKGIQLRPPWGYKADTFSWQSYLSSWKARSAPLNCFQGCYQVNTAPNLFRIGMKLEAVDRKNSYLVCVATVAGILGSRILVHFDSWDEVYDYWVETSSPYIHYVGWCRETNHELTPPNGMKASEFNWSAYLKETGAVVAPKRAFNLRPHIEFRKGAKIEAVDKRAPHLLRVATIKDEIPYQIKITFDGFPDHFGYWVDDDCPDIHPVGWGSKTGHPIEPPPSEDAPVTCPTPGCVGKGHSKGLKFETHSSEEDCPYSLDNLVKDDLIPDRLMEKPDYFKSSDKEILLNSRNLSVTNRKKTEANWKNWEGSIIDLEEDGGSGDDVDDDDLKVKRWKWIGIRETFQKYKLRRAQEKEKIEKAEKNVGTDNDIKFESILEEKVDEIRIPSKVAQDELAAKVEACASQLWTPVQVEEFAQNLIKKQINCNPFIAEEIDGEAFLMLTQEDLVEILGFKLGDAIKLFNAILLLRDKVT